MQRMILDTRLVNARFWEAVRTVLPTLGAWASVELQLADELPRVSDRLIRQLAPGWSAASDADWISPRLE
eukprot:157393-Pyramimonas_sp.AAC.1